MNINIVSIATNIYFSYWKDMIDSLEQNSANTDNLVIHLYTNDLKSAQSYAESKHWVEFRFYEIEDLQWPEATLLRYKFIKSVSDQAEGIVVYIDADMLVNFDVSEIGTLNLDKQIPVFVMHPGFWRPKGLQNLDFYLRNPKYIIKDLRRKTIMGALGDWEVDEVSTAYVRRKSRKSYVCGGFWFGNSLTISSLCNEMILQVDTDRKHGVIAKWHDESHLNEWASRNSYQALNPQYCYVMGAPNLAHLTPKIIAVEKHEKTR